MYTLTASNAGPVGVLYLVSSNKFQEAAGVHNALTWGHETESPLMLRWRTSKGCVKLLLTECAKKLERLPVLSKG